MHVYIYFAESLSEQASFVSIVWHNYSPIDELFLHKWLNSGLEYIPNYIITISPRLYLLWDKTTVTFTTLEITEHYIFEFYEYFSAASCNQVQITQFIEHWSN